MIKHRLVSPALLLLLIVLLAVPRVYALKVSTVRYDSKKDHTRFVAEFDKNVKVWKEHNEVFEYNRFWIDVYDVSSGPATKEYLLKDGLINKVKTEFFAKSGVQRFYLELNQKRPFKVWTMDDPPRLVIDVLRDGMVVTDDDTLPLKSTSSANTTAYAPPILKLKDPLGTVDKGMEKVIIIDPGHGGKSIGASRYFKGVGDVREKDIVLSVSLELEKLIKQDPTMKCYLTRRRDVEMSLDERVEFCREKKGHVFLSIHCNAVATGNAQGVEFWFVNQKGQQSQASQMLEAQENDQLDTGAKGKKSELERLMMGMNEDRMKQVANESRIFCEIMNKVFSNHDYDGFTKYNRGVKRANFAVLRQAQPQAGMLLEIGFVSNAQEARQLIDPEFQKKVARLLYDSLKAYWRKCELSVAPPATRIVSK